MTADPLPARIRVESTHALACGRVVASTSLHPKPPPFVHLRSLAAVCRYAWGRNNMGQLGVSTANDTQLIPRHVTSLRAVIVAVAAANNHSVALSAHGAVYTWGGNSEGQLGYSTRGAVLNATPRVVDALKDRHIVAIRCVRDQSEAMEGELERGGWNKRWRLCGARAILFCCLPGDYRRAREHAAGRVSCHGRSTLSRCCWKPASAARVDGSCGDAVALRLPRSATLWLG